MSEILNFSSLSSTNSAVNIDPLLTKTPTGHIVGNLNMAGGITQHLTTPGAYPYTILSSDNIILASSSAPHTILLPSSPSTGNTYAVKDITGTAGTNNITIDGNGHNIDGASTYVMNVNSQGAGFIYSGSQWIVGSASGSIALPLSIANGGTGVPSVTTSPSATSWAGWDSNANLSADSFIEGYATTATAAGTTTLTVNDKQQQYFTGSTTQTVVMPVTSTLVLGQTYTIVNLSSGVVTVQSSGTNTIQAMATNTKIVLTVINTAVTDATGWSTTYQTTALASGGITTVGNVTSGTVAFDGTVGTTLTSTTAGFSLLAANNSGGVGGAVSLTGGSTSNATSAGGQALLQGGAGNTSGAGGLAKLLGGTAGTTGVGGGVTLTGGAGGATSGAGGALNLNSGSGTAGSSAGGNWAATAGNGVSATGGAAGTMILTAGTGGLNVAGGVFTANAGAGTGSGAGGLATIKGGNNGATGNGGGGVTLTGAAGGATSGSGGPITITGGSCGGSSGGGGSITGTGGNGAGGNTGGTISFTSGTGGATGNGGDLTLAAGHAGGTSGTGGNLSLSSGPGVTAGDGGTLQISTANGGSSSGNGGAMTLQTGSCDGSGNGGNLLITTGAGVTSGTPGTFNITCGAAAGTNKNSSSSILSNPRGTGTGAVGKWIFRAGSGGTASGTTVHTSVARFILNGSVALTSGVAATISTLTLASNSSSGGMITYVVECNDGTLFQSASGSVQFSALNLAGVMSGNTSVIGTEAQTLSPATTLTNTWAVTNGGLVQITSTNTGITPTFFMITYEVSCLSAKQTMSVP